MPLDEFGKTVGALHPSPDGKIQNALLVAQVRSAMAAERSANWTRIMAVATMALALATVVLAIVAA
jgi:hypothetical protein